MRRSRLVIAALAVAALGVAAWMARRGGEAPAQYVVAAVDRGAIIQSVAATGVLQAVTTVQVGSQVSGNIQSLEADFNSVVRAGQIIARLDPSLFEARVAQMQANLTMAVAGVERAHANLSDTRQKFERARELAQKQLVSSSELDSAEAAHQAGGADLKSSQASVEQAQANLHQAQVDLGHTIIRAPIDGVVIQRSVDVGQTVAASFQAPILFVIAGDLRRMQVRSSIDEADIGQVRPGQEVTFTVDAHPDRSFHGTVEQVRLQPVTEQNVVTYDTIIAVQNQDLLLLPGMTATVYIVIERRDQALRLPAAALRFRPEPSEGDATGIRPVGRGGGSAGAAGGRADGGARDGGESAGAPEARGLVFTPASGDLKAVPVRLGISDGVYVELLGGLEPGDQVVTGYAESGDGAAPSSPAASSNPFAPQRPPRRVR